MTRTLSETPKRGYVLSFCALVSFCILIICTKSSFLYPINDWSDANIYLSMGKGMAEGKVLYQEIYDHKGPLLYALHALCSLFSSNSFLGVFLMQIAFAACFLYLSYQLIVILQGKFSLLCLPIIAVCVYTSFSYLAGDSAEELCLPFLLFALKDGLVYTGKSAKPMSTLRLLAHGFVLGCVCWIKFTLVGVSATLCLFLVLVPLFHKQYANAFRAFLLLVSGFVLATAPWLLYFGVQNALFDFGKVYLYDNLFLYNIPGTYTSHLHRLFTLCGAFFQWIFQNPLYALPTLWGLIRLTFGKAMFGAHRLFGIFAFLFLAFPIFMNGNPYPYYCLALAVFAPVGLSGIAKWERRTPLALLLTLTLCTGSCLLLSRNAPFLLQPKKQTMQYTLADVINQTKNPTLLNYGFMDAGFYTATGITPSVKYFHQTNVPLLEMKSEQIRYIEEGLVDFVITRGNEPETIHNHYTLVMTAKSPDDFWYDTVYLYQKTL